MLGCNSVCPKCQHQFVCCPPTQCCDARRSLHALTGGGLVTGLSSSIFPTTACRSPQISPSAPLSFVMPPFPALSPAIMTESQPETELQRLSETMHMLRQSGWYYEGITYLQSHDILKDKPVGTFLVRESSDPRFLFSLSVQTDRGPTSVRIHYINGHFRLDAQPHIQGVMPLYPSVIELIKHYVKQCQMSKNNNSQVWVDPKGKWYSAIYLEKPLYKHTTTPSLKHLSRLAIHKALESSNRPRLSLMAPHYTQLELPDCLTNYLSEYPHSL